MSSTVVIVGAGIVGSALAHYLSSSSQRKIILIDHSFNPIQGSSAHAPGYVGQFNDSPVLTRFAVDSVTEYSKIPHGFEVLGGIEVATTQEGRRMLQTRCEKAIGRGLPASMVTPAQAAGLAPDLLRQEEVKAALYFATDGAANATAITSFYQQEASRKGVEFIEGVVGEIIYDEAGIQVTGVQVEVEGELEAEPVRGDKKYNNNQKAATYEIGSRIKRVIQANTVILATGIWTQRLCAHLDIPIPIIPVAHPYMYVRHERINKDETSSRASATTSPPSPSSNYSTKSPLSPRLLHSKPSPWIRYPEHQVYARNHGDFYGVGTYNHGPSVYCEPKDHVAIGPWYDEIFNGALERAKGLIPILLSYDAATSSIDSNLIDGSATQAAGAGAGAAGATKKMPETKFNGIFAMTPDNLPLAGRVPDKKGLFLCAAVWVTHAAGAAGFVAGLVDQHEEEVVETKDAKSINDGVRDAMRDLDPGRFRGQNLEELKERSLRAYNQIYRTGESA